MPSRLPIDARLPTEQLISVVRPAMGTEFEVLLRRDAERAAIESALQTLLWVQHLEQVLSIYQAHSELSQLNRVADQGPVRCSDPLIDVLALANQVSEQTDGAFDVTAGPLIEAWGFTKRAGRKPDADEIQRALERVGYQHLEIDRLEKQVRFLRPAMQINLGAIGKGFALDQAAAQLKVAGVEDFLIHGGQSSVVARGRRRPDEPGWPVAIGHPIRQQRQLGRVWLHNEALSTSGSGRQFFHFRGQRMGHVIDPRSGWPAGDALSLTLISRSAAESDSLATGLFVMGSQAACDFVAREDRLAIVCVMPTSRGNEVETRAVSLDAQRWQPFS